MRSSWFKRLIAGRLSETLSVDRIPTTLRGQAQRNALGYAIGVVMLVVYNYCQYRIDLSLTTGMEGLLSGDLGKTQSVGMTIIVVAAIAFGVRVLSRLTIFNAGRYAEYELRAALLHQLHRLGPSFYSKVTTGDIMSRVTNDLQQVRVLLGFGILNLFNTSFALASALAVMLQFSVKLTIASLAPLPLLLLVMRHYSKQLFSRQRENQEALGDLGAQVQNSIAGVRVVRSFCLEDAELARFERSNRTYLQQGLVLARLRGSMWPVMQAVTMLGVLIVFWFGGQLIVRGELAAEEFLPFYRALYRLTWPLAALGFLVSVVQRGRAGYVRIKEIFDAAPDVTSGELSLPKLEMGLEVRDLSFSYGDHGVLKQVSFRVRPGERVAIVGRTGAGKSTLGALLTRLQAPPRGSIFLEGVDICDLQLSALRSTILYAQQTPFLFSTTVGRNIGYTLEEPEAPSSLEAIVQASARAQIRAEIEGLPEGLDTVVGERGVQLSGGQKQRVALARAFVASPQLLVLDDPLSAVDARTETALIDALNEGAARGQTLILITHRVSAAARCDRIVVLDRGEVVAQGTHAELSAQPGLYQRFVQEQQREQELERLSSLPGAPEPRPTLAGGAA